jgi:predicted nucleic acid-binding protein
MVGIGNLFPFEVTRSSATTSNHGSAKGADRNGSTPDPEDSPRRHAGAWALGDTASSSENAEKPAIIFVAPKRKQVHRKGPPLLSRDVPSPAIEAVLDTNVLLDWLVFADPKVAPIAEGVQAGILRWVATGPMLDELRHVLQRPPLQVRRPASLEDSIARWCHPVDSPPEAPRRLLCTDPDDQKFIDLALYRRSRWLISRDRALLKLARRALVHGVQVCQPGAWRPEPGPTSAASSPP